MLLSPIQKTYLKLLIALVQLMWGPTILFNYLIKKEWLLTGIWKERKIGYKCGVISCPRVISWQRHKTVQFRKQIHVPSGIRDVAEADISNQYGFHSLCGRAGQLLRPFSPSLMEKEAIEKLIPTGKLLCILF